MYRIGGEKVERGGETERHQSLVEILGAVLKVPGIRESLFPASS